MGSVAQKTYYLKFCLFGLQTTWKESLRCVLPTVNVSEWNVCSDLLYSRGCTNLKCMRYFNLFDMSSNCESGDMVNTCVVDWRTKYLMYCTSFEFKTSAAFQLRDVVWYGVLDGAAGEANGILIRVAADCSWLAEKQWNGKACNDPQRGQPAVVIHRRSDDKSKHTQIKNLSPKEHWKDFWLFNVWTNGRNQTPVRDVM
jgi:hypothetical protein